MASSQKADDLQDAGDLDVLTWELSEAMTLEDTMADYLLRTPRYFSRLVFVVQTCFSSQGDLGSTYGSEQQ